MTMIETPEFVRRRRSANGQSAIVDQNALELAIHGGIPAEIAAYAPKSGVVDAGQFTKDTDFLKAAILKEAGATSAALRRAADAIDEGAAEQCAAIDLAVTDANVRQLAARQMAEAFARVSENITGQVREVLDRKTDPGADLAVSAGANGAEHGDGAA